MTFPRDLSAEQRCLSVGSKKKSHPAVTKKADVRMEQVTDLSLLSIEPNLKALCRYGLNIADVQIWCRLR
jgi:Cu/Ag efflux pump CusA